MDSQKFSLKADGILQTHNFQCTLCLYEGSVDGPTYFILGRRVYLSLIGNLLCNMYFFKELVTNIW